METDLGSTAGEQPTAAEAPTDPLPAAAPPAPPGAVFAGGPILAVAAAAPAPPPGPGFADLSAATATSRQVRLGFADPAALPYTPVAAPVPPLAPARPPRVGEAIGGSFDLALSASAQVRRASIYIGIVSVALAGPAVILFLALVRDMGGFEDAIGLFSGAQFVPADQGAISLFGLSTFLAVIGLIALTFEGQIMATAIVGGAATGRRIGLRRSLRLSRRVFWSVFAAAFLVAIVDRVVTLVTAAIVGGPTGDSEAATIVEIAAAGLATMPFGFYQAGIILGGVGAAEALRRSVRIARARWRLALLVALAGIVLSYVEVFALGAGLDLVFRFADAVGLGIDGSVPAATLTVVLILACVVAVGSLIVTIAALVAAPQVFVFLKMTGYSAGLDRAMGPVGGIAPKAPRLVTLPMVGVIALGFLCALVGLATL